MTRVVGLDISLTNTGVAVLGPDSTDLFRVSSKTCPDNIGSRLSRFDGVLAKMPETSRDDLVVIEQPAFSRTSGKHHDRSGLWWFVVDNAASSGSRVVEAPPSTVKKYATGKGNAGKMEVMAAVIKRFPQLTVHDDNEADALVLACLGARLLGHPVDGELPQAHMSAFTAWQKMLTEQEVR